MRRDARMQEVELDLEIGIGDPDDSHHRLRWWQYNSIASQLQECNEITGVAGTNQENCRKEPSKTTVPEIPRMSNEMRRLPQRIGCIAANECSRGRPKQVNCQKNRESRQYRDEVAITKGVGCSTKHKPNADAIDRNRLTVNRHRSQQGIDCKAKLTGPENNRRPTPKGNRQSSRFKRDFA
jgi:hypothetical protein